GGVRAAVVGGATLTSDGGREVSGREDDAAAGSRLIGLHSRAHRLEIIRARQAIGHGHDPTVVCVTGDRSGGLVPPTGSRREHDAARPNLHGTSRGTISECCTLESDLWHDHPT